MDNVSGTVISGVSCVPNGKTAGRHVNIRSVIGLYVGLVGVKHAYQPDLPIIYPYPRPPFPAKKTDRAFIGQVPFARSSLAPVGSLTGPKPPRPTTRHTQQACRLKQPQRSSSSSESSSSSISSFHWSASSSSLISRCMYWMILSWSGANFPYHLTIP